MSVEILAVGWACPLGLRSPSAFAAVRAGLREFEARADGRLLSRLDPQADGSLDPGQSRAERAGFFAEHALLELLEQGPWGSTPAVCLASPEPALAEGLDVPGIWAERCAALSPERAANLPRAVQQFPSGRAGSFEALAVACDLLERGAVALALVGGFDSMVDAQTLARLDASERPAARRGGDRRIPGEGAAFVLLAHDRSRHAHAPTQARLVELALTREPEPFAAAGPCRGAGLSRAFAELGSRAHDRVDRIYPATPVRGWWARELSYAYLRNPAHMPEPLSLTTLYEHIGDLGAAAGAAALAAAVRGLTPLFSGHQPDHRSALVYACADAGIVGACRLEAATTPTKATRP